MSRVYAAKAHAFGKICQMKKRKCPPGVFGWYDHTAEFSPTSPEMLLPKASFPFLFAPHSFRAQPNLIPESRGEIGGI